MKKVFLLILFFVTTEAIHAQVTPVEKAALLAFYNATNGPNWNSETDANLLNNWDFNGIVTDNWFGITVSNGHVTSIDLNTTDDVAGSNNITGFLPNEIGNLQWLISLDLAIGDLTGPIPLSITTLTDLRVLNLFSHNLSGTIPPAISNLTELQILHLSQNEFTGEIPLSITTMANLTRLQLRVNNLIGDIPIEITDMLQLKVLELGMNQFTGFIYPEYGNLTNLTTLDLAANLLTGTIPTELGNLINIISFRIGRQDLTGTLPVSLRNLVKAIIFYIENTLVSGEIPVEYGELVSVRFLSLERNRLTGTIPNSIGNLTNIEFLDLSVNELSGAIPDVFSNLTKLNNLKLSLNQLSGTMPTSFSSLVSLRNFTVANNQLVGNIPPGFSSLTNLQTFFVENNQLEGLIPDLSLLPNLQRLIFGVNRFQFGDFENEFNTYSALNSFNDNPQAKVNEIQTLNRNVGDDITLTTTVSGGQNHYQWFKGGIAILGAADSPILIITDAQANDAGLYHCEITSDIVTDLILTRNDITLNIGCTPPIADNPEDVSTCESFILPTLSTDNQYYTATNAGGTQLSAGNEISTTQTIYVYSGTNGCSSENSFVITIDAPSLVDNLSDTEVCENFTLPILNNGTYFTQTGGMGTELFAGGLVSFSQTIYVYPDSEGCSDESSFNVTINPLNCDEEPQEPEDLCGIVFPIFFTPNSDGANDTYLPLTQACSPNGELSIFDRQAKLLFQTNSLDINWDGTFNGKRMPASDYWYRFVSTTGKKIMTGHFSLKR